MGLRKGVVLYFNDWIDEKIISILEEIVEQFLSLTQAQFTKKRSGDPWLREHTFITAPPY